MKNMKKLLFILLVVIGLQTQAQVSFCDSVSYSVAPGSQTLMTIGDASSLLNLADSVTWSWTVCNSALCYSGYGDTATFASILPTDTVKVCYDAMITSMFGATYICTDCDSLVYDGFSYSWVLMNMGNTTGIAEIKSSIINNGKTYDLLGREIFEIPKGTIYIKNRKKFIK